MRSILYDSAHGRRIPVDLSPEDRSGFDAALAAAEALTARVRAGPEKPSKGVALRTKAFLSMAQARIEASRKALQGGIPEGMSYPTAEAGPRTAFDRLAEIRDFAYHVPLDAPDSRSHLIEFRARLAAFERRWGAGLFARLLPQRPRDQDLAPPPALVWALFMDAVCRDAGSIRLQAGPQPEALLQLSGEWRPLCGVPLGTLASLVSALKVRAKLSLAEKRSVQRGTIEWPSVPLCGSYTFTVETRPAQGAEEVRIDVLPWTVFARKLLEQFRRRASLDTKDRLYNRRLLAFMLEKGESVPMDQEEARKLYGEAAREGDPDAQTRLALMLLDGRGGDQDERSALALLTSATRQGDRDARFHMAALYPQGRLVAMDRAEALRLLNAAAEAGQADALCRLALLRLEDASDPAAKAESVRMLRLAAEAGNAMAQYQLGRRMQNGRLAGGESQARSWIAKAAEQGLAAAQFQMGRLGDHDLEAYVWFARAADQGHAASEAAKNNVKGRLSPRDIAWGDFRAGTIFHWSDWIAKVQ